MRPVNLQLTRSATNIQGYFRLCSTLAMSSARFSAICAIALCLLAISASGERVPPNSSHCKEDRQAPRSCVRWSRLAPISFAEHQPCPACPLLVTVCLLGPAPVFHMPSYARSLTWPPSPFRQDQRCVLDCGSERAGWSHNGSLWWCLAPDAGPSP
jgi:hypothetical protein